MMGILDAPSVVGDRYQLEKRLGEGERKRVFLANDSLLGVQVAIALIPVSDEEMAISDRERKIAARLRSSPNVVTIYDADQDGDWYFIVSDFMAGGDLGSLLADISRDNGQLPIERVVEIGRDLANGLASTHENGILHLDVQPGNVWFDRPHGTAYLGDFDLAVPIEEATATSTPLDQITTLAYMPPEQVTGGACDARSDLYSLGATLYHALTGTPPFMGDEEEIRGQHVGREPDPISEHRDDVPIALELLVAQLLMKKPEDRLTSAAAVREALDALTTAVVAPDIDREIAKGESETLEFKASLKTLVGERPRTDEERRANLRKIETAAAKTLAAFMNCAGGTLMVGVSDDGEILGIEPDYAALGKKKDRDGWELYFRRLMANRLGLEAALTASARFTEQAGRTVAIIQCRRRPGPTWTSIGEGKDEQFFVRNGNESVPLSPKEAADYINREWPAR